MEQDYNLKKWSKGCPNTGVNCRRSSCGIEYVFIPAALGDDQEGSPVAPKNGSYNNAIVYYEATGNVYLYSSDGVPTRVEKNLDSIIAELQRELNDVEEALSEETTAREAADAALGSRIDTVADNLATETTARQNADTTLQNNITAEATARENGDAALNTAIASETTARQEADTNLQNQITQEAQARAVADTAINGAITAEASARQTADAGLQSQIDAITASSDVKDIVGTKAELNNYDTSTLGNNDIIKVLQDESENDATTYYRWNATTQQFTLIGEEGPYYTKSQADTLLNAKQNTLTAGSNVQIANDTISATDTTYTAGTGLALNGTQFSVDTTAIATQTDLTAGLATKQGTLTAGANVQINNNTISATDTTYTAGTGISINNNVISATGGGGASTLTITVTYSQQEEDEFTWSGATISEIESAYNSGTEIYIPTRYMGTVKVTSLSEGSQNSLYMTALYTGYQTCTFLLNSNGTGEVFWYELAQEQTLQDVDDTLRGLISNKQDKLTAGSNITISGNTISATNTTYTAGNNITISNGTISATDTTYTAGTGLSLTGTQFSIDNTVALKSEIPTNNNQLTNGAGYLTRNDYATSTTAGVIITNPQYGASTSSYTQNITATTKTYAQYQNADNATFVGKGTLENVIAGKGLVDQTALATKQDVLTAGTGISITNGVISCTFANGNGVSY